MKNVTVSFIIFFFTVLAFGNLINVPGDQSTIQAGIDAASDGDTVLVAENTYYENINFHGKKITIASIFILDQDTSHISKTVINGSQPSNPKSGSVVYFAGGTDTNSVLTGFTITGGTGDIFRPPTYTYDLHYGGGIYVAGRDGARIEWNIIENNTVISNHVAGGGGISSGQPGGPGYSIIENNIIRKNEVSGTSGLKDGCGIWMGNNGRIVNNSITANLSHSVNSSSTGGIRLSSGGDAPVSTVHVEDNIIKGNQAVSDNNWCTGGGLSSTYTLLIMLNNRVENNSLNGKTACNAAGIHAAYQTNKSRIENNVIKANTMNNSGDWNFLGGGIYLFESETSIINSTIIENFAGASGGGIECSSSNPVIKNNLIAYNTAGQDGGGIDIYDNSNPTIINNTIVENRARWGAGMAFNLNCNPVIMNTILFDNNSDSTSGQIWFWDDDSDPTITYCDIEGGSAAFGFYSDSYTFSGTYKNNMDSNPVFVSDDSLFHLAESSPCKNAGNPDPQFNDPDGSRNDMGAYGGPDAVITAIKDNTSNKTSFPEKYILFQNYPNPFNPKTVISYQLAVGSNVNLSIYNILGQKVVTLVSGRQRAGIYKIEWDAGDVSSGIYFYSLKTNNGMVQTKKMIVLR